MLDGTILRCGPECRCGGQHRKVAVLDGTSLEIVGRFSGHETHRVRVSVWDLLQAVSGTVYATGTV